MPRGGVNILHISDLHDRASREKEAWRRRRVLGDAWIRNLDDMAEESPIDLVLFTGDAADWGQSSEYEGATDFLLGTLERLKLGRDRLFVIPGNHDVDRAQEVEAWNAMRQALSGTNDLLTVARWMGGGRVPPGFDKHWPAQVARRLTQYVDWVREGLGRPELVPSEGHLGYRSSISLPDFPAPVHIIGLNTAWMCGDDSDAGKLWIFDDQLMRIAASADGSPLPGIRLLLMHHPFTDVADGAACRRLLTGYADLVLRGHLHDETLDVLSDPDRTMRELAAGCLYESGRADQWTNACHLIRVDADERGNLKKIRVRFRAWSPRGGHWHDDTSLYRGTVQGRIEWDVAQPPTVPRARPGAPALQQPYDPWTPAAAHAFVGRQTLLERLRTAWEEGRSVSLVGDWRIGKSSLLAACHERMTSPGREVKLLNCERHEGLSPEEFVAAVTGVRGGTTVDGAADILSQWAAGHNRTGLRPLLLVDEFDSIAGRFDGRFFERLRGMLDHISLGVCSRRELDLVYKDLGRTSPFHNRLEMHVLGLLERKAAEELIERSGPWLPASSRACIFEWAGRHPFFIQLFGRKLIDAARYGETFEEAREQFQTEAGARLREVWKTLSERDRTVIAEAVLVPAPQARKLRQRGLLDEDGRPFGRVLREWLREEAG